MPTDKELIELGRKAHALREKDKVRSKAVARAIKRVLAAHRPEYEGYLADEKAKL